MKIKSLIICFCTIIALASCDPAQPLESSSVITVQSQSNASIKTNDGNVDLDFSLSFTATDDVKPVYTWNLGEESGLVTTDTPTLTHQFKTAGSYKVTLIISDQNSKAPAKTITVMVIYELEDQPLSADIAYSSNLLNVNFSADVTGGKAPYSYAWNFGDSQTSTIANPTHTFASPNTYDVTLTVSDSDGAQKVTTRRVAVSSTQNKAPIAVISGVNQNYLTVNVSAMDSTDPEGASLTYTWDFGDNTILENDEALQIHKYGFAGSYTVVLTVSDGEFESKTSQTVMVTDNPSVKQEYYTLFEKAFYDFLSVDCAVCHYNNGMSRFSMGETQADISLISAEAGLITLLGQPDGFDKVFANPVEGQNNHLLTIDGDEEVTWRALMAQMRTYIALANNSNPEAVFASPVVSGLTVFVDASGSSDADGDTLKYVWDFEGIALEGKEANFSFATAGEKVVTLTVSDGKGGLAVVSKTITLVKPNTAPKPLFTFSTDKLNATFDASTSMDEDDDSFTYAWDFGDGNTKVASNDAHATHTYLTEDSFNVTLTVADAYGEATLTQTIEASNSANIAPVADFEFTVKDLNVTLISTSTDAEDQALTYEWVIDDEIVSTLSLASHSFASSGEKSITLNVRDPRGAIGTQTKTVVIQNQTPIPSFFFTQSATTLVAFDASGTKDLEGDALTYEWDFGDTQMGSSKTVDHTYASAGTYSVTLTVSDSNNQDSITRVVVVEAPANSAPRALFTYSQTGNSFTFDASSSTDLDMDGLTYNWSFGDGGFDDGVIAVHDYTGEQEFSVTLTVSDGVLSGVKTIKVSTIPKLIGDPVTGEELYNAQCFECHKEYGIGIQSMYEPIAINRYLDGLDNLYHKINTTMPPNQSETCEGQCTADIEAFMMTWERVVTSYSCPAEKQDAVKYGPRQMRLLTVEEYANTVKDLIGYEVDRSKLIANSKIHEFSNHTKTEIDFNRFKAFESLASVIADDAKLTDFVNVKGAGNCIAGGDCSGAFTGEVLPRAFRRPITAAEENAYLLAFNNRDAGTEGEPADSMHLALRTMLMSPYFLYRSEVGMNKAEYEAYIANAPTMYKSTSTPVSRPMTDFGAYHPGGTKATTQLEHNVDWQIIQNFEEGTLVNIRFKGNTSNVEIKVGTQVLYSGPSPENYKTMKFLVNGLTGDQTFSIKAPYQDGKANYLDKLEFSLGEEVEFVVPDMDDDAYALTPYEMATFLAYTYTGSTPDDELLGAANEGLFTDEEVQAQIERLLATDASKSHFGQFAAQWLTSDAVLNAEKDETLFPTYTDAVRKAMAQEVREIVKDVIFDDSVPFSNLYDSSYTFVNSTLADFYGIGGVTGDDFVKMNAPGRGGITTTGAFLSAWASPTESKLIIRGVRLRERFLCQHLPPFPSNIDLGVIREEQAAEVERVSALNNGNIRQSHLDYINTDVEECKSCHEYIINPLGVGLEDFDAAGLPRTHYANGLTVDFEGFEPEKATHQSVLYGIDNIFDYSQSRSFQGAENLGEVLASEDVTRACMVEMSFRYMMGTGPDEFDHDNPSAIVMTDSEREDYACTTDAMMDQMNTNNDNPKAALIEFGISDIVRFRKIRNR
ncbi:PKD domain-containing protein [Marinicellulosiphila megalodicopiae]|uniref:PKD domain-containing protein n=1 Tax=Marinicellulosiphila megalodicopiae TaxID=2724896 RepID=UPI003BAEFC64